MEVFLDTYDDIECSEAGNLPHMHQNGKMQWVTFRLADSLPYKIRVQLIRERDEFLQRYGNNPDMNLRLRHAKLFNKKVNDFLDAGYGDCQLNDVANRKILVDSMSKDNFDKYIIEAFVIMPNHVHLLITVMDDVKLSEALNLIKGRSAFEINRRMGRKGMLWQKESYDRLVRSDDHLKHCLSYILYNPRQLHDTQYTLFCRTTPGYPAQPVEPSLIEAL